MKHIQILIVLVGFLLPIVSKAQQIAVLDQGRNTLLANNAFYYSPLCFSGSEAGGGHRDNMLAEFSFFPGTDPTFNRIPSRDIKDGNQVITVPLTITVTKIGLGCNFGESLGLLELRPSGLVFQRD